MKINGTEINLTENFNESALQYMPKDQAATAFGAGIYEEAMQR